MGWTPARHKALGEDECWPSPNVGGTGFASLLSMDEAEFERVTRKQPIGFAPPADKPKRKRRRDCA